MAEARVYPPYTPLLENEVAPLPNEGFSPDITWLQTRLSNQVNRALRSSAPLEYSLYGVINGLLSVHFPLNRRFMIKPQAALRATDYGPQRLPVAGAFSQAPQQPNTSGGASSNQVPILADFVVAKVHETLNHDIIVCIVEVKRDEVNKEQAVAQLMSYLKRAALEYWKLQILHGFLVCGSEWTAFRLRINTNPPQNPNIEEIGVGDPEFEQGATNEEGFKRALRRVSHACWRTPTVDSATGIATFPQADNNSD
ncbi:hypothetical protein ACEPAI_9619 [Sanghuangporus weigelae]